MNDTVETNTIGRAIGGVFPLSEPGLSNSAFPTVLQNWSDGADGVYCFHNARSALHYVISDLQPKRIWLPAYLCPNILQAIRNTNTEISYFPLTRDLHPDIAFLESRVSRHDTVLTISYFGRGPSKDWLQFIMSKPDVVWIEDCAQVIDTGIKSTSAVRIYSPRKIMGVPDGGVLVDNIGSVSTPELSSLNNMEFAIPYLMREKDPEDRCNERWFKAYQKAENSHAVSPMEMSGLSRKRIETISLASISGARFENYNYLHANLSEWALFEKPADVWVPFCFPILFDQADQLCSFLAENRVFPPRYWLDLPSNEKDFPFEHDVSKKLIGLPCDQRYSREDMMRIMKLIIGFRQ